MNKLEARNSSLQHWVEMLKKTLRTQEAKTKGGEPMLALQLRVDAMTAKEAKIQAELQTRADVMSKLEESKAALQQKHQAEVERHVQDTYTRNHAQTLIAQMEEERTITQQYPHGRRKNHATLKKYHTSVQCES